MPSKDEIKAKIDELSGKIAPIEEDVLRDLTNYSTARKDNEPGTKISPSHKFPLSIKETC